MCGFRKVLRTPWRVVQTSTLLQPVDITDAERYTVPVPPSLLAATMEPPPASLTRHSQEVVRQFCDLLLTVAANQKTHLASKG